MSLNKCLYFFSILIMLYEFFLYFLKLTVSSIISGNVQFDQVMHMILGNPNLAGTIIAFILDNTVPGTLVRLKLLTDE